jgi:hypothetical protein
LGVDGRVPHVFDNVEPLSIEVFGDRRVSTHKVIDIVDPRHFLNRTRLPLVCTEAIGTKLDNSLVVQPYSLSAHWYKLWNVPGKLHLDGVRPTSNGETPITLFAFTVTVKIAFKLILRDVGANLSKLDQPVVDFLLS